MKRLLTSVLLLLTAAPAARAELAISVPAQTSVQGATITLGEIADLAALPEALQQQLSPLSLGTAAGPARHRSFSGEFLKQLVAKAAPEVVVDAPERVLVHSAYREIVPDYVRTRLEQALVHRMPWNRGSVEFTDWRLPRKFAVPAGHQRLRVHFRNGESFLGRLSAELEFSNADDPEAGAIRRSASVELIVKQPVVVTAAKLRRGEILAEDGLRVEVLDLRHLPRDVLREPQGLLGARLLRALPEGTPLLRSHVQSEPVVRRGETVRVEIEGGSLEMVVEARALEQGAPGERISLENPTTRRRFMAEIVGPGRARIVQSDSLQPGVGAR